MIDKFYAKLKQKTLLPPHLLNNHKHIDKFYLCVEKYRLKQVLIYVVKHIYARSH